MIPTRLILAILATTTSLAQAQSDPGRTVINGKTLTADQRTEFTRIYGTRPLGGNFWYDPASGLWGVVGREAFGVLRPGHAYGTLSPTASAGTTGVFINGRQINLAEAMYIKSLLGSVVPVRSPRPPSHAGGPTTTTMAWANPRPSCRAAPAARPVPGITRWITSLDVSDASLGRTLTETSCIT
jgi:hypothetical protein